MKKNNDFTAILAIVGIAALLVVGVLIFSSKSNNSNSNTSGNADQATLIRDNSYRSTTDTKKVTLVEFADYECPACGVVAPVIEKIANEYKDSVTYVFRNFPLSYHTNARVAAEAAEAAGAQDKDKYWQMHYLIYENQNAWSESSNPEPIFKTYAEKLNLDITRFETEVNNKVYDSKLTRDYNDGISVGVDSTPTFFINNKKYNGSHDYDSLKKALDEALAK